MRIREIFVLDDLGFAKEVTLDQFLALVSQNRPPVSAHFEIDERRNDLARARASRKEIQR